MYAKSLLAVLLVALITLTSCDTFDVNQKPASPAPAARSYELKVNDASLVTDGKVSPLTAQKDTFGPGSDGFNLNGSRGKPDELRYACKNVPEGDYCVGLKVVLSGGGYFTMGEDVAYQLELHLNDARQVWTSYTEPLRPENAAEKVSYQAEIRLDKPLHVKPSDVFRVAWWSNSRLVVGAIRLYNRKPSGAVSQLGVGYNGSTTRCLYADWKEPQRTADLVTQACVLTNPGVQARTYKVQVQARDYFMTPRMPDIDENLTLQPGQSVTRTYEFKPSLSGRDRLTLVAESEGMFPAVRAVKFYVRDRAWGARPNTCLSGEGWEMCYAPGAEPGEAPPAGAVWTKICVPSLQPNKEVKKETAAAGATAKETQIDHHCAWYRKKFTAANIQGERAILKCDCVLSEAWFYVNGKFVGHELHGSQPFEVDITDGFKPGQPNELLIAVRDWLAYSPRNLERAKHGEPLVVRQDLVDLATYMSTDMIGIGKPLWLEARPAVSVDDVFIVPSVRYKTLTLKYRLINKTFDMQYVTVSPAVLDEGHEVNLFKPLKVTIQAGKTAELSFEAPWKNARYWFPEDPHLYCLETKVQPESGAADCHQTRFGFREIWAEGYSWLLNGVRVKFRGSYTNSGNDCDFYPGHPFWTIWEPEKRLEAYYSSQTEQVQNWGLEVSRSGFDDTCDMADEVGLMNKKQTEFAGFCQPSFTFDNRFWQGGLETNVRSMNVAKNHPSVVYWEAGNETMWMHIYLGEVPKAFTSRWQLKIAQAMHDFDMMKRPIDWDADSDLFGKWESCSLHYPRELSVYPDIPNSVWWGPWNGKPVEPEYMFGPITLGKKPVNVGESFWLTPSLPYQPTILVGDEAYNGRDHEFRAWQDITRYFINGYRDAEFTYMDTQPLLPPHDFAAFRPQVIVFKQESASFYGGTVLTRDINIHNDIHQAAELTVRWSLRADDGREMIAPRTREFRLAPGELKRWSIDLRLPRVNGPVGATWKVELLDGAKVVHTEERHWRIHPSPSIQSVAGSLPCLFDPVGQTAVSLDKIGVKYARVTDLAKIAGKGLIVGTDAFKQPIQGAWREALTAFARNGGKVLVFAQAETVDFLPINLQLAKGKKTTIAFVRAGDHPVMQGLGDEDMRWWADDHNVSEGSWQKPTKGRWLPLVDMGSDDGMTQAPLMEVYQGKGSFLLCQMPVTQKALTAPPAGRMLQNMLDYLASPGCFRTAGRTALLAGLQSPLRAALADNHLEFTDLTGKAGELAPGKFEVAIVDVATALDAASSAAVRAFADSGGHVLLHLGSPEKQPLLEKLLGVRLRFSGLDKEPQDIQNHVVRTTDSGLMSGISNHELWWIGPNYLAMLRHEGGGSSMYFGGCPANERIADYFCCPADESGTGGTPVSSMGVSPMSGNNPHGQDARDTHGQDAHATVVRLTRPGTLIQVPAGRGYFLLNQLKFDQSLPETRLQIERLRDLLLTNLGCDLHGDSDVTQARLRRLAAYEFTPIDLGPWANRGLKDDKAKGIVGPCNQGENDLSEVPTGLQNFAGVPFLISTPKSVITLYSACANNTDLPKAVKGIKIGHKADALFFITNIAWNTKEPFKFMVHYEDGGSVEIPMIFYQQVYGWWDNPDEKGLSDTMAKFGCFPAWKGTNPMVKAQGRWGIMLPAYEWPNPHPEKAIKDVDFLSTPTGQNECVAMLIAITAATMQADEGIVTDVIDTRGVKVRLGTQVKDIYYIGVGGIEKNHWYYAAAVAAHKAMVVGQKVKIVYDVVRQNAAGQTIAYVYLGGETWAGNLVNGKVIANGLAKLGEFEGNDRLRMYLINLAEPAKWRKVGMWEEKK